MSKKQTGNKGEELACQYLSSVGYKILDRNYYVRGGEIDIVARDKEWLVFVEVKTRFSHQFGLPVESITPWKVRALLKSALVYVQRVKWGDRPYRIDLVTVDFSEGFRKPRIEVIKNITG